MLSNKENKDNSKDRGNRISKRDNAKAVSKEEAMYMQTQWQLMWHKFRKHKLAMFGLILLIILYTLGIFCEFFETQDIYTRSTNSISQAPTAIHFIDEEGDFSIQPFVYGKRWKRTLLHGKKFIKKTLLKNTN